MSAATRMKKTCFEDFPVFFWCCCHSVDLKGDVFAILLCILSILQSMYLVLTCTHVANTPRRTNKTTARLQHVSNEALRDARSGEARTCTTRAQHQTFSHCIAPDGICVSMRCFTGFYPFFRTEQFVWWLVGGGWKK